MAETAIEWATHVWNPVTGEVNPIVACECGCGHEFLKFDRGGRMRRFVSGHNVGRDDAGRFTAEGG